MDSDTVLSFYEQLGFDIIDFDGIDTLFFELSDKGNFATVSDDDGNLPESLEAPIVYNVYDENDSYLWSVTIDDSYTLQELLNQADSLESFLDTLAQIRQENIERFDADALQY